MPERYAVFKRNYAMIQAHNSRGEEVTFKMAVNQFADRYESELP